MALRKQNQERPLRRQLQTTSVRPSRVAALDNPSEGNACHAYGVFSPNPRGPGEIKLSHFRFQQGPVQESGINGLQNEDLLDIVIDRLEGFQAGPFASPYNKKALDHLYKALDALDQRTLDRTTRGVEGTNQE